MKNAIKIAAEFSYEKSPQTLQLINKFLKHSMSDMDVPSTPPKLKEATQEILYLMDTDSENKNSGKKGQYNNDTAEYLPPTPRRIYHDEEEKSGKKGWYNADTTEYLPSSPRKRYSEEEVSSGKGKYNNDTAEYLPSLLRQICPEKEISGEKRRYGVDTM